MKILLKKVMSGKHLSTDEAADVMTIIMEGGATDAQIGAFLAAERMKGEHVDELTGFVRIMRDKSLKVYINGTPAIDMCGTGGDGSGTFNISTIASFVVAGAGVPVAKHGNRSITSKCGSADLLKQLGVDITIPPEKVERCIVDTGIGFMFAPTFHPAMKHAAKPRSELGVKTLFNMMGPMTNPASVRRQLVGAFSLDAAEKMAHVFSKLGVERVIIVHSNDGMDEISLTGTTHISEVEEGTDIRQYTFHPNSLGFPLSSRSELIGGDPTRNAEIALSILNGSRGPKRDVVILNAAFGLYVAGVANSPEEGVIMAEESIDSGNAFRKLEALIRVTQNTDINNKASVA